MKLYVHGGVGEDLSSDEHSLAPMVLAGLEARTALDAVELAVRALEDDPALNAGFGSVLSRAGTLELDAGIADGSTRGFGGVMGVTVRHPITLARRVMEHTPHLLMGGDGAMALAHDMEVLEATSERQEQRWRQAAGDERFLTRRGSDTVGAVARDDRGSLAAGSSTGGIFGKLPGRVGDSPIFGAGVYASDRAAVVGTGIGEAFLRDLAAARAGLLIERGAHPQEACSEIVALLGRDQPVLAALLALDAEGRAGAAFRGGHIRVQGADGSLEPVPVP